jgi:hypothetical protein
MLSPMIPNILDKSYSNYKQADGFVKRFSASKLPLDKLADSYTIIQRYNDTIQQSYT